MPSFTNLKPKPKHTSGTCLLLDVSGSMEFPVLAKEGISPRRIEVLFKAVRETPECNGLQPFVFSDRCNLLEVIPSEDHALNFQTHGSTNLEGAFATIKAAGFYSAILVTDGQPDSESKALTAAYGLKLGIIYIGNPPIPPFLKRLAEATDGTFALADLHSVKALEEALIKALPPPDPTPDTTKNIIL